ESFRADAIGEATTPHLLAAAKSGMRFAQHHAIAAWTVPNIIALLTGLSPFAQGVHARGQTVDPALDLPLERLSEAGWTVAGLQAFMGIDVYGHLGLSVDPGADLNGWLSRHAAGTDPFLLWYHYTDTHLPYAPKAPGVRERALALAADEAARARAEQVSAQPAIRAGSLAFEPGDLKPIRALYDANIGEFDVWFGAFWRFFQASGLARDTILVVTADHGDELLERGHVGHASTTLDGHLYEEVLHVPLFLWLPDGTGAGRTVAAPTDHLDVMPTLLARLGRTRDLPPDAEGRDLAAPVMPARPWMGLTSRGGFAEPDPLHIDRFIAAMAEDGLKLHLWQQAGRAVRTALYDLRTDPGETRDVAADHPERARAMTERLEARLHGMRPPSPLAGPQGDGAGPVAWVRPAGSRVVGYADVAAGFALEWSGDPDAAYAVEYRAGEGALTLSGRLQAAGTHLAFGPVERSYWERFVLPYGVVRLRVGAGGTSWSDWITMRLVP
ncbi:MAG: sulfatase, partial [Alphaproteobacteria bacterium]